MVYFSLTAINRTINKDAPIIPTEDALVSGAVIGGGIVLKQFRNKKYKMSKSWQLKILDFEELKD